jgi:flavin reductase (DIM6/NTAB) family NADH-FMN oxidoreductase RutF
VSLGSDTVLDPRGLDAGGGPPRLFAVRGTVAHLQCRATRCLDGDATGDADHRLVLAHVERAWVREEYWDASRSVFAAPASAEAPASPYLTFLGSQTFGCVVAPPS